LAYSAFLDGYEWFSGYSKSRAMCLPTCQGSSFAVWEIFAKSQDLLRRTAERSTGCTRTAIQVHDSSSRFGGSTSYPKQLMVQGFVEGVFEAFAWSKVIVCKKCV